MSMKRVYLAIDAHARHCVLGSMNSRGAFLRTWTFVTCETELIKHIEGIDARQKILAIEEGPLAYWIFRNLCKADEQRFSSIEARFQTVGVFPGAR